MSSVIKSETKIATAQDIGVRMDDLLEQARTEVAQMSGAQAALNESAKAVAKLLVTVDSDVDGGLLDLQQAKFAKLYVNRAVSVLENLARHTSNMMMTANGKVTAFEKSVQSVSSYQEAEKTRLKTALTEIATEGSLDPVASRPGQSIKERRLAEDAAAVAPATAAVVPVAKPAAKAKRRPPAKRGK